jgi:hypothetical protein
LTFLICCLAGDVAAGVGGMSDMELAKMMQDDDLGADADTLIEALRCVADYRPAMLYQTVRVEKRVCPFATHCPAGIAIMVAARRQVVHTFQEAFSRAHLVFSACSCAGF